MKGFFESIKRLFCRKKADKKETANNYYSSESMLGARVTPYMIRELAPNEIFVFGSNLQGEHRGGAAWIANTDFGAEWGVGVGRTGQCYAIPTMHGGVEEIRPYVDDFIKYAKQNPGLVFLVTRIGCGIAGFTDEQMAPLFANAKDLPNVALAEQWRRIYAKMN
jgi:hypothetical protein